MKSIISSLIGFAIIISMFNSRAQTNTHTLSKQVSSSGDDVEESQDGSYIYMTSTDLELVYDASNNQGNQVVGMRFTGIDIPPDAEITNAWVQFTTDASSTDSTSLLIKGELSENSQPFSSLQFNVSSRQATTSQINWDNVPEWPTAGIAGPDQRSPDIASIITEITGQDGWISGNPITIIISGSGKREAVSYNGSPAEAPKLIIVYDLPKYPNDLSLKYIISPADLMIPTNPAEVTICISNEGLLSQSIFSVSYSLNQGPLITEEIIGLALGHGDSLVYTFNSQLDLSETGLYSIEAEVILNGDEYPGNNLLQKSIIVQPVQVDNIHWGSTNNTLNGLTVSWKSSGENDSIAWGYSAQYLNGKFKPHKHTGYSDNFFDYTFPILEPSSSIHYSIFNSAMQAWTDDKQFQTSTDTLQNHFTFTVAGDSRTNLPDWEQVANAMPKNDFTLFMGDIVESGSSGIQWDNWMEYGKNHIQHNLIYHQYGNHDVGYGNYENIFVLPQNPSGSELYYSFTFGNAVFISLNSQQPSSQTQYDWLINTLEEHQETEWKIVFFHKPFFSCGGHENEMDAYFDTWWKAFDDYGVDLIFNGHAHNYQRTNPINRNVSTTEPVQTYGSMPGQGRCQIISGGAGAPIRSVYPNAWYANAQAMLHYCTVEIDGSILYFKAFNQNQQVIDELTINKEYIVYQLPAGWSGFSSFQNVSTPLITDMFASLDGNLVILNDFENVYWPGAGINTFSGWNNREGVQIKLDEEAELKIYGQATDDNELTLSEGWQYLPVLSPGNVSVMDVFGQIMAKLKVIKDIGGTRVFWPEYGINTLSVLEPGKSYLLKMNEQAIIQFPAPPDPE